MPKEKPVTTERAAELKKLAADFQPSIKDIAHYDDVQIAMLTEAEKQSLNWSETKVFSEEVHKLKLAD